VIRVDYHLHTWASYDSSTGTAEVFERALRAGLDVVCITDHDTIDGAVRLAAAAPQALAVMIGCEFTCQDGSHVIGMGLREMIVERRIRALLEAIREQGARVVLPHPYRRGSGIFRNELHRSEEFVAEVLALADAVESFNARDTAENNLRNLELAVRRGLAAVAGSDAHRPAEIGSAWVEYDGPGFVDGVSPRRIYGPPQVRAREHPLKRRLMELYHANERRLPPLVGSAYRALRSRLHRDGPRSTGAPRIQHVFPFPSDPVFPAAPAGAEASRRSGTLDRLAGAALADPPAGGDRRPRRLPG
jgi:predicted metal-dependent phosphoesterase TrpH